LQDSFKLTLNFLTWNGFAIADAALVITKIVRMLLACFAFRPAGRERLSTIPTFDKAA
jgi:hypothetical protein